MSTFGGQVRENQEFAKKVGFFEAEVVSFNPDREELEKLLGTNIEKEPEYLGEKDDNTTLRVSIWLREKVTKQLFNQSYFLQDKEVVSKTGKKQFINTAGRTMYAEDINDLKEKFAALEPRVAKVGEADFVGFLDAWMKLNKTQAFNLLPNWKKLMKGDLSEIKEVFQTPLPQTITALATVRVIEKEGQLKEYQGVYRRVLPGYFHKTLIKTKWDDVKQEALRTKRESKTADGKRVFLKNDEEFIVQITDPEYGLKDAYILENLKDFDPNDFPALYAAATNPNTAPVTADDDGEY